MGIFENNLAISDVIIIYGGTFDPVHEGHVRLVQSVYDRFSRPIFLVPVGRNSHKKIEITDEHRLSMLRLAFKGMSYVFIDPEEIELKYSSTTYDICLRYIENFGKQVSYFFLVGEDCWLDISSWYSVDLLRRMVNFMVYPRIGKSLPLQGFTPIREEDLSCMNAKIGQVLFLEENLIDLASSDIRQQLFLNQNTREVFSLMEGKIKLEVLKYILQNDLYGVGSG